MKKIKFDESFQLYDLKVQVIGDKEKMVCHHKPGDYLELSGENLSLPPDQTFTIYSLAALLPILPAKQRITHENDWMTTDTEVRCPDPHCAARFKITRVRKRTFKHSDVSVVPLRKDKKTIGIKANRVQRMRVDPGTTDKDDRSIRL